MAVVQVTSLGRARDPILGACMRNVFLFTVIHDIELQVKHVQGTKNGLADALSRIYSDKGKNQDLFQMLKIHTLRKILIIPYMTFVILSNFRFISSFLRPSSFSEGKNHYRP